MRYIEGNQEHNNVLNNIWGQKLLTEKRIIWGTWWFTPFT